MKINANNKLTSMLPIYKRTWSSYADFKKDLIEYLNTKAHVTLRKNEDITEIHLDNTEEDTKIIKIREVTSRLYNNPMTYITFILNKSSYLGKFNCTKDTLKYVYQEARRYSFSAALMFKKLLFLQDDPTF